MSSLVLGDVFIFGEREYIFLINTKEIIYAALILSVELSEQVEKIFFKKMIKNSSTSGTLFCYVKLGTNRYKDRIASLMQPATSADRDYKKIDFRVSKDDIDKLIDEIKNSRGVPIELKKLISS